jgi:hypothetical protein
LLISKEVQPLLGEFLQSARKASTLAFLPRGIELQREAAQSVGALETKLEALLDQMASSMRNEEANQAVSLQLLSRALRNELLMWISVKEGNWDAAWSNLIEAEESVENAIRANKISLALNAVNYAKKLEALETIVFPPQTFNSMSYTVTSLTCSICGQDYEECEHVEGRAYFGKLCSFSGRNLQINEVSVVDKPDNKRSRVTHFSEGKGFRDKMTWQIDETMT